MKMIEHIKTVILWLLIISSVFLTWMIWTYQPEYKVLESSETSFIESERIGEERTISSFLIPSQIVIHEEEDQYWLQPLEETYQEIMENVRNIEVDQLIPTYTKPPSMDNQYKGIELIFSQKLHKSWLQRIVNMNEIDIPLETIDRILIYVNEKSTDPEVIIRFISFEEEMMYQGNTQISENQLQSYHTGFENELYVPVRALDFNMNLESSYRKINYVPSEGFSMKGYTYFSVNSINPDSFKQALFGDPEFVKHYFQGNDEVYTDGNRIMYVVENSNVLRYAHPRSGSTLTIQEGNVVEDSIDFINGHSGWTDKYRVDYWNHSNLIDQVIFRMTMNGLPVLGINNNRVEYYTMELRRDVNQITEYTRPLFTMEEEDYVPLELEFNIPSYDRIMEIIEESETIEIDQIEDIKIGYFMEKRQSFTTFKPSWFVKERDRWKLVSREEGGLNGLE
ncbi:YycH family regulatory protein [Evansella tamaricis]|uniref:Regulatory protein YycH domain-containing protein n=1 Tax=Evansella tamaricis TaxID=2069301 RepID=A0ABS6JEY8_9BACI|nr:two-component system activity regulator YycH [Evansella tamaricis]MBU9710903.1 hypothetical protein [Evansella tamaricis]